MLKAKKGDIVKVHYQATTEDLVIYDTKTQLEPLKFTLGKEEILPAFEKAIVGMSAGDSKTIHIPCEEAFGLHLKELVTTVARTQLPPEMKLQVGERVQVQEPDGNRFLVTVVDLSDSHVTLDANHPLAGKDLTFTIELVDIGKD